jgi:hypothetical protein
MSRAALCFCSSKGQVDKAAVLFDIGAGTYQLVCPGHDELNTIALTRWRRYREPWDQDRTGVQ